LNRLNMQAWNLGRSTFNWGQKTYIMGILNVTPDSFSDGGQFNTLESAIAQADQMIQNGADILDIGGQSTRPNAEEISLQAELDRVIPVIEAIRQNFEIPISVDTTRAVVAKHAIAAGADLINDISGAVFDSEMLSTVGELGVPISLMHMRGTPKTMQSLTEYQDLMPEICEFLRGRIESAIAHGITQIIIDPGIGFAKQCDQNLEIIRNLKALQSLNCPILFGASRKSFIGHLLDQPDPQKRVWGTAAACVSAIANGADIVRVHDVAELRDACRVADAIWR
jgi:dihydropteroate synthase